MCFYLLLPLQIKLLFLTVSPFEVLIENFTKILSPFLIFSFEKRIGLESRLYPYNIMLKVSVSKAIF